MSSPRASRRIKRLTQLPMFLIIEMRNQIQNARTNPRGIPRVCSVFRYNNELYSIEERGRKIITLYKLNPKALDTDYTRAYQTPFKTKIITFKEVELWQI